MKKEKTSIILEFEKRFKNEEIKYENLNILNEEISSQRNLFKEKIINLEEKDKQNSTIINNLYSEISKFTTEKTKLEENEINLKNKNEDLIEEIKIMKDKFYNSLHKSNEEHSLEKM